MLVFVEALLVLEVLPVVVLIVGDVDFEPPVVSQQLYVYIRVLHAVITLAKVYF